MEISTVNNKYMLTSEPDDYTKTIGATQVLFMASCTNILSQIPFLCQILTDGLVFKQLQCVLG